MSSHPDPVTPRRVCVLGSGALQIGQAGEFDYSGSQAIKALREEGIATILVNPNIATIQTDPESVDRVYLSPVTADVVENILSRENVDGVLLAFGGQTALNCGLELAARGVFERLDIQVLGTPIATIRDTEDRHLFVERLREIQVKTPRSAACTNIARGLTAAASLGPHRQHPDPSQRHP